MIRTVNVVEKNIHEDAKGPVVVVANTSTEILPDISTIDFVAIEYTGRYIQNLTGADMYYAFGRDCNAADYNGLIQDKQQLDCSNCGQKVSVWSASGGPVARTSFRRKDLSEHQTMKPSYQLP